MDIIARRPGPSVQEVFETDINPAPAVMREESPAACQTTADVSIARYFARGWHEQEIEKVKHGRFVQLPFGDLNRGHYTFFQAAFWRQHLAEFLTELTR